MLAFLPSSALGQAVLILLLVFLGTTPSLHAGVFYILPFPNVFCSGCSTMKLQPQTQSFLDFLFETWYFLFSSSFFKELWTHSFQRFILYLLWALLSDQGEFSLPVKQFVQLLLQICTQPIIYFLSCPATQIFIPHRHQILCLVSMSSLFIKSIINLICLVRWVLRLPCEITQKIPFHPSHSAAQLP